MSAPQPADGDSGMLGQRLGFRDQSALKTVRSRDEKDKIHTAAINGAMRGATLGAMAGIALNFGLARYSPKWAAWHLVPRTIICISPAIIGFVTQGEHAALEIERAMGREKSYVNVDAPIAAARQKVSFDDVKDYFLQNRFKVVGYTWLTVVSAVMLNLWSKPHMPTAQKIITARMYAQGTAIAAFMGFAWASHTPVDKSSTVDRLSQRHYDHILEQESVDAIHHHVSEAERQALKAKLAKLQEERIKHRDQHRAMAQAPNLA